MEQERILTMLLNRLPKDKRERIEEIDDLEIAINESVEVFGEIAKELKICQEEFAEHVAEEGLQNGRYILTTTDCVMTYGTYYDCYNDASDVHIARFATAEEVETLNN